MAENLGTWSTMAEMTDERPSYIALLRYAEGNERAISFESLTGKEAAVGDKITVEGADWRVLAVEPEEPPWAATLVCERADDAMSPSERPSRLEDDLPLHLRVLRALVEGEPTQERIDQALALANEVFELEARRARDEHAALTHSLLTCS
jgi:hypothetical protein